MTGPGPVLSARQTADLFKRVQNGESVKALAREVGVSHTTILRSFSRYGHRKNRWKERESEDRYMPYIQFLLRSDG